MATRKDNGSGTFFYDEKRDRWVATIQWTDKSNNRHRKSFTGKKKTKVKNKLDEFKAQLSITNGNISNDNTLFKDYADLWMINIQKIQLKPTSYARKELTLVRQVYPYIGDIPISQLTHNDIQNMINELNIQELSYSTIKKAYEAVRGCIKHYRIKNSLSFNPCEGIYLPTNKQKEISNVTFFNEDQVKKIKEEALRKYNNNTSDTFCQGCLRTFFAVIQNQTLDFVAHGFFARFTEMDFDAVGGLSDFLYHYRWRGFLYGQRGSGCGGAAVAGVVVHRLSFP